MELGRCFQALWRRMVVYMTPDDSDCHAGNVHAVSSWHLGDAPAP